MVTSYNGSVENTFTSLPYGDAYTQSATDNDWYHFAGQDSDIEDNTQHAQYRQYSSTSGHWMSPDPYTGSYNIGNPQSLNRYVYSGNNPLFYSDRTGLDDDGVSNDYSDDKVYTTVDVTADDGGDLGLDSVSGGFLSGFGTALATNSFAAAATAATDSKEACIAKATAKLNQTLASIQANQNRDLAVGIIGGLITGAIQNCINGAFAGAIIPATFGQVELSPVTGLAACGANALDPLGLFLGAAQGAAVSLGYNTFQVLQAKQEFKKTVAGCS